MPPKPSPATATRRLLFRHILIIRLINALSMATFFQPDEYFQALEPAWDIAFGSSSGAWLTWEWKYQLRSSLHPLLFSIPYAIVSQACKILPVSPSMKATLLIVAPAMLQGLIAALGDWYTWKLSEQIYGIDTATSTFTILLQLFSPWQWYCSSRTFSNSLETTLTIAALAHFPWQILSAPQSIKENNSSFGRVLSRSTSRLRSSLILAAVAIVLRPTNILIWLTVALFTICRLSLSDTSSIVTLTTTAIVCGSSVVGLSLLADRLYFSFWTFPPYNWLNFNISKSLAVFYGRNPWHYYLLQGIPLLCTTYLPFTIPALFSPRSSSPSQAATLRVLSTTVFVTCITLSFISHKEVRFIYPLLPTLTILASPSAASFFTTKPDRTSRRQSHRNGYFAFGLAINILLAGYLSYAHQRAPLTVLSFLRGEFERIHPESPAPDSELFALFLMPCHSTPWRSHLIYPSLNAYALSCDPPLHTLPDTPERENYRDEADRFYDSPISFLTGELFASTLQSSPRYIAGFEGIEPLLHEFSASPRGKELNWDLKPVWSGFNGLFHEDWRRAGNIVVWDTGVYE